MIGGVFRIMAEYDFDRMIDEYLVYCHSRQLSKKTMASYEQSLRLFRRWCGDELKITTVDRSPRAAFVTT